MKNKEFGRKYGWLLVLLVLVGSILACDAPVATPASVAPAVVPTEAPPQPTEVPVQPTIQPWEIQGEGRPICFMYLVNAGQSVCKTGNLEEDYRKTLNVMVSTLLQCNEWCSEYNHSCTTDQDVLNVLGPMIEPWLISCPADLAKNFVASVRAVTDDKCQMTWQWPDDLRLTAVQVVLDGQAYGTVQRQLMEGGAYLNVCETWLSSKPAGETVSVEFKVIVDGEVLEPLKVVDIQATNFSYSYSEVIQQ